MGYRKVLNFEITDSLCTAFLCIYDDIEKTAEFKEIYKFRNNPVKFNGHNYCDVLNLFRHIKKGISKVKDEMSQEPESVSISDYGIEYVLLDKYGYILQQPLSYDDCQINKMAEKTERFIKRSDVFNITGADILKTSTLLHLMSENDKRPYIIENTYKLLLTADFINYMLTGEIFSEYTNSYSTQLINYEKMDWSEKIISILGLRRSIFPKIIHRESYQLLPEISEETGCKSTRINVSGSLLANTSVILKKYENSVIINSDKETHVCILDEKPALSKNAYEFGIVNTGVFDGKYMIMHKERGINLIDDTIKCFTERKISCNYSKLENTALTSSPLKCFINPDIMSDGNIPIAIQKYCQDTSQYIPQNVSEMMRCIYESIAFRYATTIEKMSILTKKEYSSICMTGRDSKNEIICQTLANVCGVKVVSGIEKPHIYGNFIMQLIENGVETADAVKSVLPDNKFNEYEPNESREEVLKAYKMFNVNLS